MIGYVVIGRNEGARLRRALAPLTLASARVVYVDSASRDDSIAVADQLGAKIVRLGEDQPLTAARARNAGYQRLIEAYPDTAYAMFVDGDCELAPAFPEAARGVFGADPNIGVVAGRVREREPEATIYNRLCELEWTGPTGEIDACGGIMMIRRDVFDAVKGFDPRVVAAEDDDLCIRVRAAGWKVWRIADEMCLHDAAMTRFGQWWRRAVRAGRAYGQVGELHSGYFSAERLRAVFWGAFLPFAALGLAPFTGGWSLLCLALYPVSFMRARHNLIRDGAGRGAASLYAGFLTLSKFPNFLGLADYWRRRLTGAQIGILEYK